MNQQSASSSVPQRIGGHVDQLLAACWLPARWKQRILLPSDLPIGLEICVRKLPANATWRAYTDGSRVCVAIALFVEPASSRTSARALEGYFFDDGGHICAAGVWEFDEERGWRLYDVIEVSNITH